MKGLVKKIGIIALAGVFGAGALSFAGCSNDEYANMSTISIHYYNGGLGRDWVNESIAEFEELFKDVSFEEGKKGVHVALTPDKQMDELPTKIATGSEKADIIYTSDGNPVQLLNTDGILYDTTAIATEKVYNADGELTLNAAGDGFAVQEKGYSMYDRMHPYYKETYNLAGTEWQTNEGDVSFSLLPYEDTLAGIVIDYDLYEELCIKYGIEDEMTGYTFEGDAVAMPGTWNEFFKLLTNIRDRESHNAGGYSGFMYAVDYYTGGWQDSIVADVDGTDEDVTDPAQYSGYKMYTTYRGQYDFDGDGTKETTITDQNHHMLTQTRGYRAAVDVALRFFEHGSTGGENYDNGLMNNPTYSTAQMNFVMSKTSNYAPRILALFEGDWWENEARATFNSMGAINAENAYGKRKFRMMPTPHYNKGDSDPYIMGAFSSGYPIIVNAKTVKGDPVKEKLVKLWLQFTHSDSMMNVFTAWSGSVRPYIYDISEETKSKMTPFAQGILEMQLEDRKNDGEIKINRRNQITVSEDVRMTTSPVNFATKLASGSSYRNGNIIANMVTMRKSQLSWEKSTLDTILNDYMDGMLRYRNVSLD